MTKVVDINADQHAATRRAKNAKKRSQHGGAQRQPHSSVQSANSHRQNRLKTAVQNARVELMRKMTTKSMRWLPMLEIAETMLDAYMGAPPIYKEGKILPRLFKAEVYTREQFVGVDKDRLNGGIRAAKDELNHQLDLLPVT